MVYLGEQDIICIMQSYAAGLCLEFDTHTRDVLCGAHTAHGIQNSALMSSLLVSRHCRLDLQYSQAFVEHARERIGQI